MCIDSGIFCEGGGGRFSRWRGVDLDVGDVARGSGRDWGVGVGEVDVAYGRDWEE